ncbi:hypothetical protein C5167_026519 [Papaver somniferum]|nr:hypothetical protein C5167_026519 [Papaver somniferum]
MLSSVSYTSFSFHHHHHLHHQHHHNQPLIMTLILKSPPLPCSNNTFTYHSHSSHRSTLPHHSFKLLNPKPSGFRSVNNIPSYSSSSFSSTPIEKILPEEEEEEGLDLSNFDYSDSDDGGILVKNLPSSPVIEVKELEELPEQWRRTRIAWLCKELPSHKPPTALRLLNAQRKWITQEDATYIAVHSMRKTTKPLIGVEDLVYTTHVEALLVITMNLDFVVISVYKWMIRQRWFQFDFALATRLADYTGKERKFSRCREIFDDIINKGRVSSESTFHILTVAYLSSSDEGCLEEACGIYNRMIQFGGYQPRLSLHNSLFRALIGKTGGSSKQFLQQAEFIFHNIKTCELEIQKDIYAGLIWLHSYQDEIDRERIMELRKEMQRLGFEEGTDVLVSILRAYSKEGDVEGTERTWLKLLSSDATLPYQAFVYRMEVYSKIGEPMKSLDIFRAMQDHLGFTTFVAYNKIIEVMSKTEEIEIVGTLVDEFITSGLKPLLPAFTNLMRMYSRLNMHGELEAAFLRCVEKCIPNRTVYNIYLESLVKVGNFVKASEIFNRMQCDGAIGVNSRACNTILGVYLLCGENDEAEKVYDLMCQKKFDVEPLLMEKLGPILSLSKKVIKKPTRLNLTKEQREILIGLLLGGLQIESDEERKVHAIQFEFNQESSVHSALKRHIHDEYHEWVKNPSKADEEVEEIPSKFSIIAHTYFGFYAHQFWPKGRPSIPKLIHRWLSPRVLAYWYMYGGRRTSSGDILLKLKGGNREDVDRIVKSLKAMSLDCKVKKKGRVSWIGFFESNSLGFWKLTESYILDNLKDLLEPDVQSLELGEDQDINFDSETDSEEYILDHADTKIN